MPRVEANSIEIEYEAFGDPSSPALILIMGLGRQLIYWREAFCDHLADRGLYVIRFDNRDSGLSTKLDELGVPDVVQGFTDLMQGREVIAPYTEEDMAEDTIGLLDALNIEKAHLCGVSMGGWIAQHMAITYPQRVLSLISMMSSTSDLSLPNATPEVLEVVYRTPGEDRESIIQSNMNMFKMLNGPVFSCDEAELRLECELEYDRSYHRPGTLRQAMASFAQRDRTALLASVKVPTLVIHGSADPLMPVEHGIATAKAIPGAELMIIEGMGHNIPDPLTEKIVEAIYNNILKAKY